MVPVFKHNFLLGNNLLDKPKIDMLYIELISLGTCGETKVWNVL